MNRKEYYDQYILPDDPNICPTCGKETSWLDSHGMYKKYCSRKCLSSNPDVIRKAKETNMKKYGNVCSAQNDNIKEKIIKNNIEKFGYVNPMKNENIKSKWYNSRIGNVYNDLIMKLNNVSISPLFEKCEYDNVFKKYEFKCDICGNMFESCLDKVIPKCPICHKQNTKTEKIIINFLKNDLNIKNIHTHDRTGLVGYSIMNDKPLEVDIYLPEYKLGIEVNGIYYHSSKFNNAQKRHVFKTEQAIHNNIQLLHIFDNEILDENKLNIWKSILSSKIGITNRIYARKCIVKEVNNVDAKIFLNKNHLQGYIPSKYNYGLYFENELVSLLTLSKSRYNKKYEYEILRYANKAYTTVIGGFSKLLIHFIKKNKSKSIMTYSDRRYSNGNVYQKNGFKLINISQPNYFYTKNFIDLESRIRYQKHKLSNLLEKYDENLSESKNMENNGYYKIYDCGNLVWGFGGEDSC